MRIAGPGLSEGPEIVVEFSCLRSQFGNETQLTGITLSPKQACASFRAQSRT